MNNSNKGRQFVEKLLIVFVTTAIAFWAFLQFGNFNFGSGEYCLAKVTEVTRVEYQELISNGDEEVTNRYIYFRAYIQTGKYSGLTVDAEQYIDNLFYVNQDDVIPGSRIVMLYGHDYTHGTDIWQFAQYNRDYYLAFLAGAFLLLIVLIGRRKGVATIYSLFLTIVVIFMAFIPAVLRGANTYVATILVCAYIIFMTLLLLNGFKVKTLVAIIGNLVGIVVSGLLSTGFGRILNLTGVLDEDYAMLMYLDGIKLDLNSIIWGGILIGALGAIMDVAMSISSALNELAEEMRERSFRTMWRSGMNIGRDAIGTMTNTLILAYIGCDFATVLLLAASNKSLIYLMNLEMIVVQIFQAIVGSMGILFTVPITTLFAALIYNGFIGKKRNDDIDEVQPLPEEPKKEKIFKADKPEKWGKTSRNVF